MIYKTLFIEEWNGWSLKTTYSKTPSQKRDDFPEIIEKKDVNNFQKERTKKSERQKNFLRNKYSLENQI